MIIWFLEKSKYLNKTFDNKIRTNASNIIKFLSKKVFSSKIK